MSGRSTKKTSLATKSKKRALSPTSKPKGKKKPVEGVNNPAQPRVNASLGLIGSPVGTIVRVDSGKLPITVGRTASVLDEDYVEDEERSDLPQLDYVQPQTMLSEVLNVVAQREPLSFTNRIRFRLRALYTRLSFSKTLENRKQSMKDYRIELATRQLTKGWSA